jgi:hypothetical protein
MVDHWVCLKAGRMVEPTVEWKADYSVDMMAEKTVYMKVG